MKPTAKQLITVALAGMLTMLPLLAPMLPPSYKDMLVAGIAMLTSFYHLFQEPPK